MADIFPYFLAKGYTKDSLIGGGAVVGKNVIMLPIVEVDGGHEATFQYTLDDGTVQTQTMFVENGKDGESVALNMPAVTLEAAGWVNNKQTVNVAGALADESQQAIIPMPVELSREAYQAAKITTFIPTDGVIEFTAETVPTDNLFLYVALFGVNPGTSGGESTIAWYPAVDADGNLSWSRISTSTAPQTANIKGPQGEKGEKGDTGEQGIQGIQGIQGEKGNDGYPFLIYKEYASLDDFSAADFPEIGLMFMVNDGIAGTDKPVYRYTGETDTPYSHITDMSTSEGLKGDKGEKGDQGEQGVQGEKGADGVDGITYTPVIGTIQTVTAVQDATAEVVVDSNAKTATFNFSIPRGEKGADAPQIDDTTTSETSVWSSRKVETTVVDAIAALENGIVLNSSTEGSTKRFELRVDDDGRLVVEEIA